MTLRRKLVALTLSLLLLFAMTAAASVVRQSKIGEQFSGVVDDYLPLIGVPRRGHDRNNPWHPPQRSRIALG